MNMAEGMMGGNKPQGQGGYQEGGQQSGGTILFTSGPWQTTHCIQGAQRQSACLKDPAHRLARAHELTKCRLRRPGAPTGGLWRSR